MSEVRPSEDYEALAEALIIYASVRGVNNTHESGDPEPSVWVVLDPHVERVPPGVLRAIADLDFGVRDVSRRGRPRHLILEVV